MILDNTDHTDGWVQNVVYFLPFFIFIIYLFTVFLLFNVVGIFPLFIEYTFVHSRPWFLQHQNNHLPRTCPRVSGLLCSFSLRHLRKVICPYRKQMSLHILVGSLSVKWGTKFATRVRRRSLPSYAPTMRVINFWQQRTTVELKDC